MNFFRLRVVNTLLLFFIGIVLGFILKDKFYPARPPAAREAYRPVYPQGPAPSVSSNPDNVETPEESYLPPEEEPREPAERPPARRPAEEPAETSEPAVIEPASEKPAPKRVARGEEENFFSRPAQYEGRELEMDLQMITARKSSRGGWRLNLVYSGPGRKIDYLYVDDAELLGDKPDLRIGYVYRVRFTCGKGETSAGNTLTAIAPTGAKADWATGLSAIE